MNNKKQSFSKKHKIEIILAIITSLISIIFVAFFVVKNLSLANADSIARLNLSRRFFDSLTPGFSQLGYVWLPINHLFMLPLIWINSLWHTGLAGISISAVSFIASSILIYKIGEKFMNRTVGFVSWFLFVLNPNILYMQATPLTEMFFLLTLLAATWFLLNWAEKKSIRDLVWGSLFLLFSTVSRYDGWFIALVAVLAIGIYDYATTRDRKKAEATLVISGTMSFFGTFLWIVWNWIIFKDPLYFAFGQYSARGQQQDLLSRGLLPSYHDLWNSLLHTLSAGELMSGWVVTIVAFAGCIYLVWIIFKKKEYYKLFFFILFIPLVFYVVSLWTGNGVIYVPNLWPHFMHNIRYGIILLPFLILASTAVIFRYRFVVTIFLILVMSEYILFVKNDQVITLRESLYGFAGRENYKDQIIEGKWMGQHYDGGLILADTFKNDPTTFYSGIQLKDWLSSNIPDMYNKAIDNPAAVVDWIFIRDGDEVAKRITDRQSLGANFILAYKYGEVEVYKKKENLIGELSFDKILQTSWDYYKNNFIQQDGATLDSSGRGITSESQSYSLLRAVLMNDKETFDKVLYWSNNNLRTKYNNLYIWNWPGHQVTTQQDTATDADEDIALALLFAYKRWGDGIYLDQAKKIITDIWQNETILVGKERIVVAGNWATKPIKGVYIINPSYLAPYAYRIFADVDKSHDWNSVVDSSYDILEKCSTNNLDANSSADIPPDWCGIDRTGKIVPAVNMGATSSDYSYDAVRTLWRIALDYKWFNEQRAINYFSKMDLWSDDWNKDHKINAIYTHAGMPRNDIESLAHYGTQLAFFTITDRKIADDFYQEKIITQYDKDSGFWGDKNNYYDQNWIWFGLAFYSDNLPNLWAPAQADQ